MPRSTTFGVALPLARSSASSGTTSPPKQRARKGKRERRKSKP